ncbi:hypothetical protein CU102_25690 [Phyllobacterium brassicacearum]|uniref:Uncharacterized protein n=1 Tax=Phyllobacterium brassicacearum TaxID=314235 RepID=A0A2P7B7A8_9HYPH|nr:hypothetical protein CU102_25690 [Phyllobacterium brassicacearum]TDQ16806.1 hypothetical protein DEV91_13042 [Phyllobacterium brassicacearum]
MPIHKKVAATCDQLKASFPDAHFLIVAVTKSTSDGSNRWNIHSDLSSTEIPQLVKSLSTMLQNNVIADAAPKGSA